MIGSLGRTLLSHPFTTTKTRIFPPGKIGTRPADKPPLFTSVTLEVANDRREFGVEFRQTAQPRFEIESGLEVFLCEIDFAVVGFKSSQMQMEESRGTN